MKFSKKQIIVMIEERFNEICDAYRAIFNNEKFKNMSEHEKVQTISKFRAGNLHPIDN